MEVKTFHRCFLYLFSVLVAFIYLSISESATAQGNEHILQFISDLGGWPVLDTTWDSSTFDLEERLAMARQYTTNFVWPIPHGVLMGLNILNDYKVYGKHVLYVSEYIIQILVKDHIYRYFISLSCISSYPYVE